MSDEELLVELLSRVELLEREVLGKAPESPAEKREPSAVAMAKARWALTKACPSWHMGRVDADERHIARAIDEAVAEGRGRDGWAEHWAEHYATQSKLTALIQAVETSVEAGTHFTREELALRAALEEAKR